jgi:internalin A
MPKGIVTQVIVAMHEWIAGSTCVWKSGVMLEKDETFAEIIEVYNYGVREIKVRTSGRHKKEFLTLVGYELGKIHKTYSELRCKTLILSWTPKMRRLAKVEPCP